MAYTDRYGLTLSTSSAAAAEQDGEKTGSKTGSEYMDDAFMYSVPIVC
jgi:hypothetical protein